MCASTIIVPLKLEFLDQAHHKLYRPISKASVGRRNRTPVKWASGDCLDHIDFIVHIDRNFTTSTYVCVHVLQQSNFHFPLDYKCTPRYLYRGNCSSTCSTTYIVQPPRCPTSRFSAATDPAPTDRPLQAASARPRPVPLPRPRTLA